MCRRIHTYLPELFTFVGDPALSSTNNAAERSVRPVVCQRKISGGTRSPEGTRTFTTLATLFGTWPRATQVRRTVEIVLYRTQRGPEGAPEQLCRTPGPEGPGPELGAAPSLIGCLRSGEGLSAPLRAQRLELGFDRQSRWLRTEHV